MKKHKTTRVYGQMGISTNTSMKEGVTTWQSCTYGAKNTLKQTLKTGEQFFKKG